MSKPTGSPTLPIEVCEHIIDALGNSPLDSGIDSAQARHAMFQNCELVCRAWLSRARIQLFRQILLANYVSMQKFLVVLDANPWLGPCVEQILTISWGYVPPTKPQDGKLRGFEPRCLFALLPTTLLARPLPSLNSLVNFFYHEPSPRSEWDSDKNTGTHLKHSLPHVPIHPRASSLYSVSCGATIRQLILVGPVFANFADLTRVLNGFHELRSLHLTSVTFSNSNIISRGDWHPNTVRRKPFLKKLQVLVASN